MSQSNKTHTSTPRISVVMGVYNSEKTVRAAIESIISQSYKNWEFIICDDKSSDSSFEIIQEYASQDSRIIALRNEKNVGCNIVLNRCIEQAKGEYIAIMDSDDISHPLRLEKELNILANNPQYSIVGSAQTHFDEKGDFMIFRFKERPDRKDLIHGIPHGHPSCMIRSKVMREIGGYYTEKGMHRIEDYYMMAQIYALGYRGYNLQEPLLRYRDGRCSYTHRTWRIRLNELHTYSRVFNLLRLRAPMRICLLRPLLVGLLPRPLYHFLHRRRGTTVK